MARGQRAESKSKALPFDSELTPPHRALRSGDPGPLSAQGDRLITMPCQSRTLKAYFELGSFVNVDAVHEADFAGVVRHDE